MVLRRIALYAWGNQDATFSRVRVYPSSVTFQDFAIDDAFAALRSFQWTFVDDASTGAPSSWDVVDEHLVQTSSIGDSDPTAAAGTRAMAGDPNWDDYRVTATVQSSSGGALGLVFRASPDGYYRFAMNRDAGTRSLVSKQGGTYTVLFSEPFTFELSTDYVLSVECVGAQLTGYVNGVRVFSITDDAHATGNVGLYTSANPGAAFDQITVALAQWLPIYRFGKERALPAGTRLRIFSGSPSQPFSAGPLEGVRHVASPFEKGEVQLPNTPVNLRVVGPNGPEHQRRFLLDEAYAPVPLSLLRRRDGTSYALVRPGGAALDAGEYRLRLSYQRSGAGQALSERGDTTDEVVQLDIPWRSVTGEP